MAAAEQAAARADHWEARLALAEGMLGMGDAIGARAVLHDAIRRRREDPDADRRNAEVCLGAALAEACRASGQPLAGIDVATDALRWAELGHGARSPEVAEAGGPSTSSSTARCAPTPPRQLPGPTSPRQRGGLRSWASVSSSVHVQCSGQAKPRRSSAAVPPSRRSRCVGSPTDGARVRSRRTPRRRRPPALRPGSFPSTGPAAPR